MCRAWNSVDADDCKRVLGEIALARATLIKPEKRRLYDATLTAVKNGAVTPHAAPAPVTSA